MPEYRLTSRALRDLTAIVTYLAKEASPTTALRIENRLFALFEFLAQNPGAGHRRSDITPRDVRFHPMRPYIVIYEPNVVPVVIHAVLHSARDIATILKTRMA